MTSTQLSWLLLYTTCPIYNLSHNLLACSVSPQSRNAWQIAIILMVGLGEGILNFFFSENSVSFWYVFSLKGYQPIQMQEDFGLL